MNSQEKVLQCYNQVADDYAAERWEFLYDHGVKDIIGTDLSPAFMEQVLL
jgi:hypothetical protein